MEEQMKKVELSKKDVVRSFWRWTFFSHANYNYERLAGTGFCHAMAPIIEKLYKDNRRNIRRRFSAIWSFIIQSPISAASSTAW